MPNTSEVRGESDGRRSAPVPGTSQAQGVTDRKPFDGERVEHALDQVLPHE